MVMTLRILNERQAIQSLLSVVATLKSRTPEVVMGVNGKVV
jgi:hypothetical protein